MKSLASLKKDLEFNRGLANLIEVLKNIAVFQYRALEQKIVPYDKFFSVVDDFFASLNTLNTKHPFLSPQNDKQLIVTVTSNSGLVGGLNMEVINSALKELESSSGKLVIIGERGKIYLKEKKLPFVFWEAVEEDKRFSQAMQLRDYLRREIKSYGYLKIIYPHPVSFTVQKIVTLTLIPWSNSANDNKKKTVNFILESKIDDIIKYLVFLWVGRKIYEILGLSRLSEFAARFVHLEASKQKLNEINKKIQLQYFRIRHEIIDRNMRELFSARAIYAGQQ